MTKEDRQAEVERLKERMIKRELFVMFRQMVAPGRIADVLLEHYRWIIALEKTGVVFASGPLSPKEGGPGVGMTVFRASSFEEAEALAAGDPFVTGGAAEFRIERWQLNEGRVTISIDYSDQTCRLV